MFQISIDAAIARLAGRPRGKPLRLRPTDEARKNIEKAALLKTGGNASLFMLAASDAVAREVIRQSEEKRTAA